MTQTEKVMKYMEQYGSITSAEALSELGIMRLASRISDLKQMGVNVKSVLIKDRNRFGEPIRYARYFIAK